MLRFVLLSTIGICQAWQQIGSLNDQCSAEISILKGTKLEASLTGGRVPYQFKYALQEVLKSRVSAEGCNPDANTYDLFFGMNVLNVIRFLDASDKTLNTTTLSAACDTPFGFNWKKLKADFQGVVLPSSCTTASYQATKKCQAKLKLLDNLFIELVIQDLCTDTSQPGYGLPSINVFCSGSMCDSFARPCLSNSDCGAGITCDSMKDTSLADSIEPLIDMGLFANLTDYATCSTGGSFGQRFWSGIINSGAYLAGLTNTVSKNIYLNSVGLCGVQALIDKYVPPQQFQCYNGTRLPLSVACDGISQCANGEDERMCNATLCGAGKIYYQGYYSQFYSDPDYCCSVCPTDDERSAHYCSNEFCAGGRFDASFACPSLNGPEDQPINCPDLFLASTTPIPTIAKQTISSATPASSSQHILGWTDCNGNVQIGSSSELGVLNARLPFPAITAELERQMKDLESCRTGTQPTVATWARQFFPWAVNFWGGIFYSDAAVSGVYGDITPAGKLDQNMPYYPSADDSKSPNYANVANAPKSCDLTSTTTGTNPSCELAADVGSWFTGAFPAGWSSTTTIKAKAAATCTTSSLPSFLFTCEGGCDANSQSGCCILSKGVVSQPQPAKCPPGYKLTSVNAEITDFIFNNQNLAKTTDTTLQNFISLVVGKQITFNSASPFINPLNSDDVRSLCLIDGSTFENNTETWIKTALTEDCSTPGVSGCPRFVTSITGCTAGNCLSDPKSTPVVTPGVTPTGTANPAAMVAPILGVIAGLGAFTVF